MLTHIRISNDSYEDALGLMAQYETQLNSIEMKCIGFESDRFDESALRSADVWIRKMDSFWIQMDLE